MNPIGDDLGDDDLVLYHYRDGLDPERIAQITAALAVSPALRERYVRIERAVEHFGQHEIAPDPDLGSRLWRRLEPKLVETGVVGPRSGAAQESLASRDNLGQIRPSTPDGASVRGQRALDRLRAWRAPAPLRPALVATVMLVTAIGVGFFIGRQSATVSPPVASIAPNDAAAARVLHAYVAANLRATEGVLLTASNSDDASLLEGNREIAQSLVESNRLYAVAAARGGNTRLADFLRQLEPVLLSLANQPGTAAVQSSEDLRRFLETTDLLFQVRATEARLERDGKRRT